MEKQEALNVLINTAEAAQQKGIFNLKTAKLVAEAVETLRPEDKPITEDKKDA